MNARDLAIALRRLDPEPHPEPTTWEAYAAGELAATEREALLDHALVCGRCSRTLRAVEVLRRSRSEVERRSFVRPRWALAAAALVLAVGLGPALRRTWKEPQPPAFDDTRGAAREAGAPEVAAISPSGRLAAPPREFRWRALDTADGYRVLLFDGEGVPLAASAVVEGVALDAAALGVAWRGGDFFWRVEASRSGSVIGSSKLVAFRLP